MRILLTKRSKYSSKCENKVTDPKKHLKGSKASSFKIKAFKGLLRGQYFLSRSKLQKIEIFSKIAWIWKHSNKDVAVPQSLTKTGRKLKESKMHSRTIEYKHLAAKQTTGKLHYVRPLKKLVQACSTVSSNLSTTDLKTLGQGS